MKPSPRTSRIGRATRPEWTLAMLALAAAVSAGGAAPPADSKPPKPAPAAPANLLAGVGATDFVFCARRMNDTDGHWYANIGYYAHDPDRKAWREGTKLYRWNAATKALTTLLDDPRGGVRDPQVHYDGRKVLFSYRKGGTEQYHLYEIDADGRNLRQLTDSPTTTSSRPTCPTARSSSSRPAASAGSTAGSPRWP